MPYPQGDPTGKELSAVAEQIDKAYFESQKKNPQSLREQIDRLSGENRIRAEQAYAQGERL